ncbi:MAG: DUF445 family protein [Sedimentibacter sp.]
MNDVLLNYIAQAILGGASGFITNDYAINMLFKEYTPLKIGGVIKKTRNEFIDNLSSIVENDIINKDKLHEILNDDAFKEKFETLTADFFHDCIYEAVGKETFSDIDGFESSLVNVDKFVADVINEHIPEITNLIIDYLKPKDILNEIQLEKISDSLYITLNNALKNTDITEKILLSFYNQNKHLKIKDVFKNTENSPNVVIHNIFAKFVEVIKTNDYSVSVNDIFDAANFNTAVNSAKVIFYDKELKDIVNISNEQRLRLSTEFTDFINSERGQQNVCSLCNSLFFYVEKCDKSIFQLLDSSFEEGLKDYIAENLPHVTKVIINWINENSLTIDKIIEESIDEVIKESDGLKGKLLSTIKNTYFHDLSQKYSIVQKIISYVENITEPEKLGTAISSKLIELLNNLSVSEVILEAEKNNVTASKAATFVSDYLNNNFEIIFNTLIDNVENIHVKDILPEYSLNNINLNMILTSNTVIEMLEKKSIVKINNMMSVDLENILNEPKAKEYISKANNFTVKTINSNSGSVKDWINGQITSAADEKGTLKNQTTYEKVSEEIYKKYAVSAENLKIIKISHALDKLNSIDNISINSSEALRSYVINNTDSILKGSVKGIVSSNLNKLSDDELVDFANEFIGRELKPIMYFGGILGVAAGIILAAIQNSPVNPGEINISSMITYAFVGFSTNVIAINMLFRPYKEKKFLSKIPFLRHFSLGFIIKNQKSFAKSTAHFIDNNLLSKKSINELFTDYKSSIKGSFVNSVADNNYETISNILTSNKPNIANSLFSYGKVSITNNMKSFSNFIAEKIVNFKLSSLFTDNVIKKLSKQGAVKIFETQNLASNIYLSINSKNKLNSKFSNSFLNKIFTSYTTKYYSKLKVFLSDESSIKNYILKFEDKYRSMTNKSIDDMLDVEKKAGLSMIVSEKISSIILSQSSRNKVSQSAVNLFNRVFDKNKSFEELFDGKLKEYIDKKMPDLLKNISTMVKSNVKESKGKIALMVQSEIKSSLGFLERGMYTIVGGDEIVDELLKKIIEVKVPRFIDEKEDELNNIASSIINEKFYKAKVQVLHSGLDKIQLNELIDKYLDSENSAVIESKIQRGIEEIFKKAGNKNLNDILKFFSLNDLNSILKAYYGELNALFSKIQTSVDTNQEEIINKISLLTFDVSNKFMNTAFNEIFEGISQEDVKIILDNIIEILGRNEFIEKAITESLDTYKSYVSDMNLSTIINKNEFIKSTENYVKELINNQGTEFTAKAVLTSVIDEAASENFSFINEETKLYALNSFVDACILSLKRNLYEILKAIEFDRIAKEEIEKMESKKVHEMFNSFGGKYFKNLMLYGFGGFVFGINMYVGLSLTALKIISEIFTKKD